MSKQVKDLGEQGLLKLLHKFCPSEIVGDDAAILTTSPEQKLVVTTDVFVENVHFSDVTTPAFYVGWRAAAANLSDLAAMGAKPLGITVGLCLKGDTSINWVESVYEGMKQCLDQYNTPILGGDLCRSSVVTIAITALGEVLPNRIISRKAAQPGDAIVITGFHGLAKAGLELLLHPELNQNISKECQENLILAHQQPQPRLDVLDLLPNLESLLDLIPTQINEINTKQARLIGGMDSSDGLADAIIQICRNSEVGAEIEVNSIPLSKHILELTSKEQALEWVLYGGEDFELVICLPFNLAKQLISKLNANAAIIGRIIIDKEVVLIDNNRNYPKVLLSQSQSFQHF